MKKKIQQIVNSHSFQNTVVLVIVLCSLILGIETLFVRRSLLFEIIDVAFTVFFVVEIGLRIVAANGVLSFFRICTINLSRDRDRFGGLKLQFDFDEHGFWNWFDTLIAVLSVLSLLSHWVAHPEFLVVSRLFRASRIFRLLEISSELKAVEKKIISIIPTVFSFVLLLGVLLYIYSIVGIYLFGHNDFGKADFSSLSRAFLTLFQLMTLDGWADIMNEVSLEYDSWFYKGYFLSFVILTAIISFNVFVAILTSQVHEKMQEEARAADSKLAERIGSEIEESEIEVTKNTDIILKELRELRAQINTLKSRG